MQGAHLLRLRVLQLQLSAALRLMKISHVDTQRILYRLDTGADAAYEAAAPSLGSAKVPPLVSAALVSGLGVPGALVEVSAVAAVM